MTSYDRQFYKFLFSSDQCEFHKIHIGQREREMYSLVHLGLHQMPIQSDQVIYPASCKPAQLELDQSQSDFLLRSHIQSN